jgi:hypothetical protein
MKTELKRINNHILLQEDSLFEVSPIRDVVVERVG